MEEDHSPKATLFGPFTPLIAVTGLEILRICLKFERTNYISVAQSFVLLLLFFWECRFALTQPEEKTRVHSEK